MTKRIYHYHIRINFEKKRPECNLGNKYSEYQGGINKSSGVAYSDSFHFFQDHLQVIASRGTSYTDGTILTNEKNSIYAQMLKALIYYYGCANDIPQVKKVTITRKQAHKPDYVYTEGCNFLQPVSCRTSKNFFFSSGILDIIFSESEKSRTILTALSYWLKSFEYESSSILCFDVLWRAFNCLYRYQANSISDNDGLRTFREFIINNSGTFSNTIKITTGYPQNIWNAFRWRALILNDYKTESKMCALRDFIMRYHDKRIMESLNNVISARENYLINKGFWTDTVTHIHNNLTSSNDVETLCILVVKYAYFIRCKNAHGEVPDNSFKLEYTNMDKELERLNELFVSFIYEIINNHNLLR